MDLSRVLDLDFKPITLPRAGLVINERVAQILRLRAGDVVEVEVLEGRRGVRLVPVTEVIKSYFGLTAFMDLDALDELMYGPRLTGVHIAYDARPAGRAVQRPSSRRRASARSRCSATRSPASARPSRRTSTTP